MKRNCAQCAAPFEITEADLALLDAVSPVIKLQKYSIPAPTRCPACRQQRRFTWRNERRLFMRPSDLTGIPLLSMYPPEHPFTVYDQKEWWSDQWDGLGFNRPYDFSKTFFEQFEKLRKVVPHIALSNDVVSSGCEYVNQTTHLKNSYYVFNSDNCEQTLYASLARHSTSCVDCTRIDNCELCYELIDCSKCYQLQYSQDCEDCANSAFLKNCKGCTYCFGCVNLQHRSYCYFNTQLSKDQYEKRIAEWRVNTSSGRAGVRSDTQQWYEQYPVSPLHLKNAEQSTGNYLRNVKNAHECFDCDDVQDCRYCTTLTENVRQSGDFDVWGTNAEHVYEAVTVGGNVSSVLFSASCWGDVSNIMYSELCAHSSNLFGCVGLRRNQYCILNKQYTKEEYEDLVPRIIEQMKKNNEWGEFFPPSLAPLAYNITVAQEYHPLKKEQALEKGYTWYEDQSVSRPQTLSIPEAIEEVPDTIVTQLLVCVACGKNYRVIELELQFYREMKIPVPRICPDCRHACRARRREPRTLCSRTCSSCTAPISTTHAPDRPEKVLCDACYESAVKM